MWTALLSAGTWRHGTSGPDGEDAEEGGRWLRQWGAVLHCCAAAVHGTLWQPTWAACHRVARWFMPLATAVTAAAGLLSLPGAAAGLGLFSVSCSACSAAHSHNCHGHGLMGLSAYGRLPGTQLRPAEAWCRDVGMYPLLHRGNHMAGAQAGDHQLPLAGVGALVPPPECASDRHCPLCR